MNIVQTSQSQTSSSPCYREWLLLPHQRHRQLLSGLPSLETRLTEIPNRLIIPASMNHPIQSKIPLS